MFKNLEYLKIQKFLFERIHFYLNNYPELRSLWTLKKKKKKYY